MPFARPAAVMIRLTFVLIVPYLPDSPPVLTPVLFSPSWASAHHLRELAVEVFPTY